MFCELSGGLFRRHDDDALCSLGELWGTGAEAGLAENGRQSFVAKCIDEPPKNHDNGFSYLKEGCGRGDEHLTFSIHFLGQCYHFYRYSVASKDLRGNRLPCSSDVGGILP